MKVTRRQLRRHLKKLLLKEGTVSGMAGGALQLPATFSEIDLDDLAGRIGNVGKLMAGKLNDPSGTAYPNPYGGTDLDLTQYPKRYLLTGETSSLVAGMVGAGASAGDAGEFLVGEFYCTIFGDYKAYQNTNIRPPGISGMIGGQFAGRGIDAFKGVDIFVSKNPTVGFENVELTGSPTEGYKLDFAAAGTFVSAKAATTATAGGISKQGCKYGEADRKHIAGLILTIWLQKYLQKAGTKNFKSLLPNQARDPYKLAKFGLGTVAFKQQHGNIPVRKLSDDLTKGRESLNTSIQVYADNIAQGKSADAAPLTSGYNDIYNQTMRTCAMLGIKEIKIDFDAANIGLIATGDLDDTASGTYRNHGYLFALQRRAEANRGTSTFTITNTMITTVRADPTATINPVFTAGFVKGGDSTYRDKVCLLLTDDSITAAHSQKENVYLHVAKGPGVTKTYQGGRTSFPAASAAARQADPGLDPNHPRPGFPTEPDASTDKVISSAKDLVPKTIDPSSIPLRHTVTLGGDTLRTVADLYNHPTVRGTGSGASTKEPYGHTTGRLQLYSNKVLDALNTFQKKYGGMDRNDLAPQIGEIYELCEAMADKNIATDHNNAKMVAAAGDLKSYLQAYIVDQSKEANDKIVLASFFENFLSIANPRFDSFLASSALTKKAGFNPENMKSAIFLLLGDIPEFEPPEAKLDPSKAVKFTKPATVTDRDPSIDVLKKPGMFSEKEPGIIYRDQFIKYVPIAKGQPIPHGHPQHDEHATDPDANKASDNIDAIYESITTTQKLTELRKKILGIKTSNTLTSQFENFAETFLVDVAAITDPDAATQKAMRKSSLLKLQKACIGSIVESFNFVLLAHVLLQDPPGNDDYISIGGLILENKSIGKSILLLVQKSLISTYMLMEKLTNFIYEIDEFDFESVNSLVDLTGGDEVETPGFIETLKKKFGNFSQPIVDYFSDLIQSGQKTIEDIANMNPSQVPAYLTENDKKVYRAVIKEAKKRKKEILTEQNESRIYENILRKLLKYSK